MLEGKVVYLSADAITDGKQGALQEVYLARVTLLTDQLHRISGFTPTPGTPAKIMIQTQKRTVAQYIGKPIVDSMSRAFREQ